MAMKRILQLALMIAILGIVGFGLAGKLASSSCCGDTLSREEVNVLKTSSQRGDIKAIWRLQEDAANRGAVDESLSYLKRLAVDLNVNEAKYLYFSTIANDPKLFELMRTEAIAQLISAAQNGHAPSQFFLASYFEEGRFGFKKDEKEARKWYRASAKNGNHQAAKKVDLLIK